MGTDVTSLLTVDIFAEVGSYVIFMASKRTGPNYFGLAQVGKC